MRRALEYLVTAWLLVTVNFFLPRLVPGDPLLYLTGEATGDSAVVIDEATREQLRRYFRLDLPLSGQYAHYMGSLLSGDLGSSIRYRASVGSLIAKTVPWSLLLVLPALLIAALLGSALGAIAAWRRGGRLDRALVGGVVTVMAVPAFLLALLLQLLFSVKLGALPVSGAWTVTPAELAWTDRSLDVLRHAILPVAALTLALLPDYFLLARNNMLDVLGKDYMMVARLKGLPRRALIFRHALRNALLPLFTHASLRLGLAASGMIFVESVFSYPGMGDLIYRAVTTHDYPLAQGIFLVITLSVLTISLAIDVAYRYLDPRVRCA